MKPAILHNNSADELLHTKDSREAEEASQHNELIFNARSIIPAIDWIVIVLYVRDKSFTESVKTLKY